MSEFEYNVGDQVRFNEFNNGGFKSHLGKVIEKSPWLDSYTYRVKIFSSGRICVVDDVEFESITDNDINHLNTMDSLKKLHKKIDLIQKSKPLKTKA